MQEALTWLLENNRYYRANAIRLNEKALQQLPQDGNLTDMRSLQLGESSTYQCEPSEDLYGAIFPLHLFLMLHSRGQSKRLCSSSFKTYRVDRLTPLCGPPLEEHRSMNSPLKDTYGLPHLVSNRSCRLPWTTLQPSNHRQLLHSSSQV